jgi:hypothetical protein
MTHFGIFALIDACQTAVSFLGGYSAHFMHEYGTFCGPNMTHFGYILALDGAWQSAGGIHGDFCVNSMHD